MSIRDLEKGILKELKEVTKNPKLKLKNIMEWCTAKIKPQGNEKLAYCPKLSIYVSYKE